MKKFNINDEMYIQINDSGWAHLRKTVGEDYIKHCIESRKVTINGEVWYKLQCHNAFELMPIIFGREPLFKTNVMFEDNDLTD